MMETTTQLVAINVDGVDQHQQQDDEVSDDEAECDADILDNAGIQVKSLDDEGADNTANLSKNSLKSAYRQKYKRAWELDHELKDWLAPFVGDQYAAYCRNCHCKLHAHKKGLLAHSKSTKHKKHLLNPDDPIIGDSHIEPLEIKSEKTKRNKKSTFNDQWLEDPQFNQWLRKIPTNNTKALCIACRSVITAGRSELLKHNQAAKHKKAIEGGISDELTDIDLEWLDPNYVPPLNNGITLSVVGAYNTSGSQSNQGSGSNGASGMDAVGMNLSDVVNQLNDLVPLHLAEGWDNVGLLVQPSGQHRVQNIFLTIDLTEKVMEEAIKKKANLIISYHPPIFRPMKSLTQSSWKERLMVQCVENRIAVYSPHTALDAVKGGINDWLISAYGPSQSTVITQSYADATGPGRFSNCLEVLVSEGEDVTAAFSSLENVILTVKSNEYGGCDVRICCDDKTVPKVVEILSQHPVAQLCTRITKLQSPPLPGVGMGRIATLLEPLPIYEVVDKTKMHLNQLPYVRLALSPRHSRDTKISTIAVCAGSGASVLAGVKADVLVTGEMSHHEVLDATHRGSSVILCEHTNTERGFLKNWVEQQLKTIFQQQVNFIVSEVDKDPLRTV